MIKQGLIDNGSILEKKYKILRTSIMLGNLKNKEETLSEYEETVREIDKIKKSVYEEILSSKMYTTTTLEEEKERLTDLINYIEKRIDERNEYIDDYIKVTNNFLDNLDRVEKEDELTDYRLRLDNILEYLSNEQEIKDINNILKEKRNELEEKYENKANNEIINSKLEDELIDEFNKIVSRDEYYKSLNYIDIDEEISKIDNTLLDKKDVMETFISSYEALKNAGISGAEREEYLSYVQDSKLDYYNELEKRYILNIYKLVLDKQNEYEKLYEKRLMIDNILSERNKDRLDLSINDRDILEIFITLCNEQLSVIKSQKYNMENIDKLIVDISNYEDRLIALERANSREDIQEILNEYSVITPEIEKVELPEEEKIYEDVINKNNITEKKPDNMVIRIKEPIKMNIKNVSDTAKLVMKKVVIVLEPKKFNRDKLKEAELELEERKRLEKIKEQERKLEEEFNKEQEKLELEQLEKIKEEEHILENIELPKEDILDIDKLDNETIIEVYKPEENEIIINENELVSLNNHDIFTDDDPDEIENIDKSSKIEIEIPDNKELFIPTEIFIEDTNKEETVDLFKQTDPFLDDNEFEIQNKVREDFYSDIPLIKNIGTVKPNNILSKLEEKQEENNDIILPTMGLTDKDKESIPIVSENYIN
ncbi:MAG: hypothetical protein IJZ79_06795 [Bacilli bacterium]|nr:hypothetical protein [Bacilli bacterium]